MKKFVPHVSHVLKTNYCVCVYVWAIFFCCWLGNVYVYLVEICIIFTRKSPNKIEHDRLCTSCLVDGSTQTESQWIACIERPSALVRSFLIHFIFFFLRSFSSSALSLLLLCLSHTILILLLLSAFRSVACPLVRSLARSFNHPYTLLAVLVPWTPF